MSRLKTILNNRITAGDFTWDERYTLAWEHANETRATYITSQGRIGLRFPLMKHVRWIHQNVETR